MGPTRTCTPQPKASKRGCKTGQKPTQTHAPHCCSHCVRDPSARPAQPPTLLISRPGPLLAQRVQPNRPRSLLGARTARSHNALPRCSHSVHGPSRHIAQPSAFLVRHPAPLLAWRVQPFRPCRPSACASRRAPLPCCLFIACTSSYPALSPTLRYFSALSQACAHFVGHLLRRHPLT